MTWVIKSNRLTKTYSLKSFDAIIQKLLSVTKVADEMKHHPDFEVKNYNQITFRLWTHAEKSVTEKDHLLSGELDKIFSEN